MIDRVRIVNFQSHEKSTLDLLPGVNVIVGSSDTGKSVVMRALLWAVTNRPSGGSFVSHWARNEKGKQEKICRVVISKGKIKAERIRTEDTNGYALDGEEFEAVRTDVPEQVADFFNLSEVNIQRQMDSPFLLSATPGEVARFFNRTIKLDEIDRCLSLVESRRREATRELKQSEDAADHYEKALERFEGLEEMKEKGDKAGELENRIKMKIEEHGVLQTSLLNHRTHAGAVEQADQLAALEGQVEKVDEINADIGKVDGDLFVLRRNLVSYREHQKVAGQDFDGIEDLIAQIDHTEKKIEDVNINLRSIDLAQYLRYKDSAEAAEAERARLEEQLPEMCPACGRPL